MRMLLVLLCVVAVVSAETRHGVPGWNEPASVRGWYTVEAVLVGGMDGAYGLAIQDDVTNSIWISEWDVPMNIEYSMQYGSATGNSFAITEGVDPDDAGFCEYASGDQFFFGHWGSSAAGIFDTSGEFFRFLDGPTSWDRICGIGAGGGFLYASSFMADEIAWAAYTGTESSVTWTTATFASVSGMSVWGDYLFVCCQITGADNLFIFQINGDGSVNMTPIWSCEFIEEDMSAAGGIDFDGSYVYLFPQNTYLYKLDIDWAPGALEQSTWGAIKAAP